MQGLPLRAPEHLLGDSESFCVVPLYGGPNDLDKERARLWDVAAGSPMWDITLLAVDDQVQVDSTSMVAKEHITERQ